MYTYNPEIMHILFQGYSRSETWYAVLDYGTNYCNLHNLITGTTLSATDSFGGLGKYRSK